MKVLLLHEMSGVHTELKRGLQRVGIRADIATFGDGFKAYRSHLDLGPDGKSLVPRLRRGYRQVVLAPKLRSYDVIQTISPEPFFRPISRYLEEYIFSQKDRCFYVAAGSDAIYRKHVRELDYFPPHDWYEDEVKVNRLMRLLQHFKTSIPVCWEYQYSLNRADVPTARIIPFPIDVARHKVTPLGKDGRITFFHPLNRTNPANDFKGTSIIRNVFSTLSKKYSKFVRFICKGSMPHQEYNEFVDGVDVIVDQLYSYSYGMSAAYGLAKGKIVLSGLEDPTRSDVHYADCPVINVKPSAQDLTEKIELLISQMSSLAHYGQSSRAFAEKHHESSKVALQYAEIWGV